MVTELIKSCLTFRKGSCPYQSSIEEIYHIQQLIGHEESLEFKKFCLSCPQPQWSRRKELRVAVSFLVSCQGFNHNRLGAKALNLSAGGVAIKTNYPVNIGEQYKMEFIVPDKRYTIEVVGKVAWREFHGDNPGPKEALFTAGIKFLNLEERFRTLIYEHTHSSSD